MIGDPKRPTSQRWLLDILVEKHEKLPYTRESSTPIDVRLGSQTLRVLAPVGQADVDVLAAAPLGRLIVVLGSWRNRWARQIDADGVLMVAWPLEDDTYAVGVWHQLHIGTLDTLRVFLL